MLIEALPARRGRPPNPVNRAARRAVILAAARRCFRARGFHRTSTADICEEADTGPATLYRYFSTKEALILAIIEEDVEGDLALVDIARQASTLREGLHLAMEAAFADLARPDNDRLRLDALSEALRTGPAAEAVRRAESRMLVETAALIATAQERGEVPAHLNPVAAASVILAVIDGLSFRDDLGAFPTRAAIGTSIEMVLAGLGLHDPWSDALPPRDASPDSGSST